MALSLLTMSRRELDRAELMVRVRERRLTQAEAARQLGLSVRQVERLYRSFKTQGAVGLVSKKRGRPSPRRTPELLRLEVLRVVRERYADFGPTLAQEKLHEAHGLRVSVETLRKWLVAEGLWVPRAQRAKRPHPPRARRSCLGELVQIDGCDHEWFEDRAPRCVALVYIDDATGRLMQLRFADSESAFSYFEATRGYLQRYGRPVALYSDKAGVFRVNTKQPKGGDGTTQFGRAMAELNIDVVCANSPQAKGRVERAHQTLQDRLVKELRLRGIATIDAANAFAPTFMAAYDERFAREPASPNDAHRPLRHDDDLSQVLRWKETRKLTNNLTLHYGRVLYVVDESPAALSARGKQVEVHELEDGSVSFWFRSAELTATPFRKDGCVRQRDIDDNKLLGPLLAQLRDQQIARDEARLPKLRTLRERRALEASIAERRAPTTP